jgi:hypothetical protein
MKAKEWVKLLKPLTEEVIKRSKEKSEEATQVYDAYSTAADKLYNECKEIIDMRMNGFKEAGPKNTWLNGNHINDKMVNAIREASVKYRAITHALRTELNVEVIPFPLMDCAMFMPMLISFQNTVMDGKRDYVTLKRYLEEVTKMATDLQMLDDDLVKFFLNSCKEAVSTQGTAEYFQALGDFNYLINVTKRQAEDSGQNPMAVLLRTDGAKEMMLKVRGLQNSLGLY